MFDNVRLEEIAANNNFKIKVCNKQMNSIKCYDLAYRYFNFAAKSLF